MPLDYDHRPKDLDSFMGNQALVISLRTTLKQESRPHTYLFEGPRGCGKTTLGYIVATWLGCQGRDLIKVNCADQKTRGIDSSARINEGARMLCWDGPVKVYLLDEFQEVTPQGQTALLDILENPPKHVYFVLCTTEPARIKKTVLSRCTRYKVTTLTDKQVEALVNDVLGKENATLTDAAMTEVVLAAGGIPREALKELEKRIYLSEDDQAQLDAITSEEKAAVTRLSAALLKGQGWPAVIKLLQDNDMPSDPERIRWAVLGYMRKVMLNPKPNVRATHVYKHFQFGLKDTGDPGLVMACWEAVRQ